MINKNFYLKDNIAVKRSSSMQNYSKKFDKIILKIKNDIKNEGNTLHVLDKNFKFNFKIKELKKFTKFKTIAIIGMGGSILGAQAIYNFFHTKIKKKYIFLMILMKIKLLILKKKKTFLRFFLL